MCRPERPACVPTAPIQVRLPAVDVQRQRYVEIRDRRNRSLVTVIEFLSPSNKRSGPDREQYLTKRGGILASRAHLVEIDLLRCQTALPTESPRPDCTYSVLVSRRERRPSADFWSIGLRDRLPSIPVPLRPGQPDATLDLQAVLDRVYDEGGFAYLIDGRARPTTWITKIRPGPRSYHTPGLREASCVQLRRDETHRPLLCDRMRGESPNRGIGFGRPGKRKN